VIGRVIAAWLSFALTCSYELLMRQIRRSSATRVLPGKGPRPAELARPQLEEPASPSSLPLLQGAPPVAAPASDCRPEAGVVGGGRILQRRAWQWALAHHQPDGSLPTGTEVAREFRRSERWGGWSRTSAGPASLAPVHRAPTSRTQVVLGGVNRWKQLR
jgi:hypothetical protein